MQRTRYHIAVFKVVWARLNDRKTKSTASKSDHIIIHMYHFQPLSRIVSTGQPILLYSTKFGDLSAVIYTQNINKSTAIYYSAVAYMDKDRLTRRCVGPSRQSQVNKSNDNEVM